MAERPGARAKAPRKTSSKKGAKAAARRRSAARVARFASAIMTLAFVGLTAVFLFIFEANRPGPMARDGATIVVPRGASVTAIGRMLQEEGAVRNALAFRVAAQVYAGGAHMQAGEYAVERGDSMRAIITRLTSGRSLLHPITIAEGLTSQAAIAILASSDVLTGETPQVPPEGALLPETYAVPRGTERATVLRQMVQAQQETLEELWRNRADNLPVTTPEEAVILASIVEKETGVPEERPRVAAVFVNRLRRGMRLESDPTIIYGVCRQLPARCVNGRLVNERTGEQRGIRQSEIDLDTGYNTYRIPRLPPTPIANPGRASLEAVLNPPDTNDLFFVADGTGGHAFAATNAEHSRNVARWRAIERGQ
ncbi:MAG: endolytic transglycosylase MltG [Alphaproteobacteria bacterium]|nr:endolytic transglycosylase MltG [Alphaproteobacteria bacterium]